MTLIGAFRLATAEGAPVSISSRRGRGLLAYLAIEPEHEASREKLCGLLWSDRGGAQARGSLRQVLLELRDALSVAGLELLEAGREQISLRARALSSDVDDLTQALAEREAGALLTSLEDIGRGRLLEDLDLGGLFQEWLDQTRARLDQSIATGADACLERLEAARDWPVLRAIADAVLYREPLDEAVTARVIRAEAAVGNVSAAHRRAEALRTALLREFGVEPGAAVREALAGLAAPDSTPPPGEAEADQSAAAPVVAVLAFDNLSGDPEMAYFSDGLSEEIQEAVARRTNLMMIGRASCFQFRGAGKAAANVAAHLNATHVLDGSVRRSGHRVRISTQLIECATATTCWSDRFDRELADVFALQDEIASAVATALKVAFAPNERTETIDPAAHDLYLTAKKARENAFFYDPTTLLYDAATLDSAIKLVEQATNLAPRFANAWAYLARLEVARCWLHRLQSDKREYPFSEMRSKIILAATTALSIDPNLGEAYQVLSDLEPFGALTEREALHKKALSVTANDPRVLLRASVFCSEVGRTHEALGYVRLAHDLDPMDRQTANWLGCMLDSEGRYQDSRPLWDRFQALWPESNLIAWHAVSSAVNNADWSRFDDLVKVIRQRGQYTAPMRRLVWFGRNLRDPDADSMKQALHQNREEISKAQDVPIEWLTGLYRLGFKQEVFELVDQASFAYIFDRDQGWAGGISVAVLFSAMHSTELMRDSRFPSLCAKLGLCDYWVATGRWPDCADQVPYDFRAEARRLAASPP